MPRITKERLLQAFLTWLVLSAAISAIPLCITLHDWRHIYWLNTDGKQAVATVTAVDPPLHKYAFTVGRSEYTGRVKLPRDRSMEVGDKFEVFYSTSHPWISSLGKPPLEFKGWGFLVTCCLFICLVVLVPAVSVLHRE